MDVHAPGQPVLASYAGDWLLPVDGTSFAAPLVAWRISLVATSPFDPVDARTSLLTGRDADDSLSIATFARDSFYDPSGLLDAATSPLIVGEQSSFGIAARIWPPARADLRLWLRPLELLRSRPL